MNTLSYETSYEVQRFCWVVFLWLVRNWKFHFHTSARFFNYDCTNLKPCFHGARSVKFQTRLVKPCAVGTRLYIFNIEQNYKLKILCCVHRQSSFCIFNKTLDKLFCVNTQPIICIFSRTFSEVCCRNSQHIHPIFNRILGTLRRVIHLLYSAEFSKISSKMMGTYPFLTYLTKFQTAVCCVSPQLIFCILSKFQANYAMHTVNLPVAYSPLAVSSKVNGTPLTLFHLLQIK